MTLIFDIEDVFYNYSENIDTCDKPFMDKSNLKANEENSITCKSCLIKYHLACFPVNSEVCGVCEENDDTV